MVPTSSDGGAGPGPGLLFWLWMTVTVGGLIMMFAIVIGGR